MLIDQHNRSMNLCSDFHIKNSESNSEPSHIHDVHEKVESLPYKLSNLAYVTIPLRLELILLLETSGVESPPIARPKPVSSNKLLRILPPA